MPKYFFLKKIYFLSSVLVALICLSVIFSRQALAVCEGSADRNCSVFPDATSCSQNGCSWIQSATPTLESILNEGGTSTGADAETYSNCVVTSIGGDVGRPTNNDNCGYYQINNPLGNFGDPTCTLSNSESMKIDQIYKIIMAKDSANWAKWKSIIECESQYNPQAYNPHSTNNTAWGLLQMGPSYLTNSLGKPETPFPGLPADVTGLNGITDRGDLSWELQIQNAIAHNARSKVRWSYWACR